jgi:hypothetical protein
MEAGREEDYPIILCEDVTKIGFHSPTSEARFGALGASIETGGNAWRGNRKAICRPVGEGGNRRKERCLFEQKCQIQLFARSWKCKYL